MKLKCKFILEDGNQCGVEFESDSNSHHFKRVHNITKQQYIKMFPEQFPNKDFTKFIVCQECKQKFKSITRLHLMKIHNMTLEEYKEKYPDSPTYILRTKKIICSNCGKENVEVNVNIPNSIGLCLDCRNQGERIKNWNDDTNIKRKATLLKNSGFENASQDPNIKIKKKETYLKNTNGKYDNPMKNPETIKTQEKNNMKKRGVKYVMQDPEVLKKWTDNFMSNNNGAKHPLQIPEKLNAMLQVQEKRYGGVGFSSPIIKQKIKETIKLLYNTDNVSKLPNIKEKREQTNLRLYGKRNFAATELGKQKIRQSTMRSFIPKLNKILESMNLELLDNYTNNIDKLHFRCKICNNIFIQKWNFVQQYFDCPICFPKEGRRGVGHKEVEVFNFVKSLGFNQLYPNDRTTITPLEIDILIGEVNTGIEFDELYGHSEVSGKLPDYHLKKTNMAEEKNIHLIHIFEDEWDFKKELVQNHLKHILNRSDSKRIHARKCKIIEIKSNVKNQFLDLYHLQGRDSSKIKLGAIYEDELVAVMTFSFGSISKGGNPSDENTVELNRFCSNYNYRIPGIASKLLAYFKRNYQWKKIYSYADRRWSKGNMYYKLGFKLESITKPNYWYLKRIIDEETSRSWYIRLHRFGLRKTIEERESELTEVQLRAKQGYIRIWDCGNLKFVLDS